MADLSRLTTIKDVSYFGPIPLTMTLFLKNRSLNILFIEPIEKEHYEELRESKE